jgi:ribosomal protein L7/L12
MDRSIPEAEAEAIRASIFAGRKIEAIKRLRESTGLDLLEAKTMVEKLEQELRASSPEKFTARSAQGCSAGAAVFLLLFIGLAVAGVVWVILG